ncbi:hypothetical protein EYY60_16825 [Flavobacterium zhairuonense]|uniref:hypothetical protein n=1 Tax=Flavobacterium zhairuonense TaxID=2493631 RepID=UPI00104B5E02|nr:hypothetical protein [Flavobacterium zhairuonense]KAF2507619.1 hypothetical protein EYY60_16825 [Flavobacterium zhairuonense]
MTKMISLVIISLLLFSCTSKEKKVDVLWQKVLQSKNAKEEEKALQNFWSDFHYERIGVSIFYKKENGSYKGLEKLSKEDTVKSIKVEISFGNNNFHLVKINENPKDPENYFLLYRDH